MVTAIWLYGFYSIPELMWEGLYIKSKFKHFTINQFIIFASSHLLFSHFQIAL